MQSVTLIDDLFNETLPSCCFPQKILTMIPTEEEKQRIQEAQLLNPDIPLGSAEQFLLTLSSITELSARLQLWAFKMDYELTEKVRHIYLSKKVNLA